MGVSCSEVGGCVVFGSRWVCRVWKQVGVTCLEVGGCDVFGSRWV